MTRYDVVGWWVLGLCKKPAWGRKFPPLEPPAQDIVIMLTTARLSRIQDTCTVKYFFKNWLKINLLFYLETILGEDPEAPNNWRCGDDHILSEQKRVYSSVNKVQHVAH